MPEGPPRRSSPRALGSRADADGAAGDIGLKMIELFFENQTTRHRREAFERIVEELSGLLTLRLSPPPDQIGSYRVFRDDLECRVAAAIGACEFGYERQAIYAILTVLTSDADHPIGSVIDDIAEILFLERTQRSEYVQNPLHSPPFAIGKLLLEYAMKSRRLDQITGELTKAYCANRCGRLPIGCCSILGYDLDLVPRTMLTLQKIEARRSGWVECEDDQKCRYHADTGCVLSLFKSPACIGYLCEELMADLAPRAPAHALNAFVSGLSKFRNSYVDRANIFWIMDETIDAGYGLIDELKR